MKRVSKVMLGLAAFLLMAGGLLALAGRTMGATTELNVNLWGHNLRLGLLSISGYNYDYDYGHDSDRETAGGPVVRSDRDITARNLAAFANIEIDVSMVDVEFKQAEDFGVALSWNKDRLAMDYSSDGDTLKVWNLHSGGIGPDFMGGNYSGTVIVYLPKDVDFETIHIAVSMGNMSAQDLSASYLSLSNSMGEITLKNSTANTLELDNSMGALTAENCTVTERLTANNSMGDISLSGDLQGAIELDNSMADIAFATTAPGSDFGYDLSTSMAEVRVNGKGRGDNAAQDGGSSYLTADNSMADIDVRFGD